MKITQKTQPTTNVINRWAKIRRYLWISLAIVILVGVGTAGWIGYSAYAALSKISDAPSDRQANVLPQLPFFTPTNTQTLKGESDNRINILLLGIGGGSHPGAQLTDTMMVVSIAPKDSKIALLSIPRDLYVPIPGAGYGKINSANAVGEKKQSGEGAKLSEEVVSNVLGIPIHYYVRVDFDGFTEMVDALGGLDINVEKDLYDNRYPAYDDGPYKTVYIKAGLQHMNGQTALEFARSRETTSDFDRSHRQQLVLSSMKAKALSLGTLSNPKKLAELLTIAGNHVKTDMAVWEMERFASFIKEIDTSNMVNKVLDTAAGSPLTSRTDENAGYIIVTRKGNFSEVQQIARSLLSDTTSDKPVITVVNASGKADLGGNVALLLRGYGYEVKEVTQEPTPAATSHLYVHDLTSYPDTVKMFKDHFGIKPTVKSSLDSSIDFSYVIGQDYIITQ